MTNYHRVLVAQTRVRKLRHGDQVSKQEGQHPLTGQRAANFRLLANQSAEHRLVTQ